MLRPSGRARAVLLYHHGYTESPGKLLTTPDLPVTDLLLGHDYLIASTGTTGDSWRGDRFVDANLALLQRIAEPRLPLGHIGVSMGCAVALNCAADRRFGSSAVAGIAPVCDTDSVRPWRAVSPGVVNPMTRPMSHYRDIAFRFWAADEPAPVSKAANADRFASMVADVARDVGVVCCSGGHDSDDQYRPGEVVDFFDGALAHGSRWTVT